MTITGIDGNMTPSGGVPASGADMLGKDDFLRLLITQLQSQDPLNPMESTEFTAQLAQFSSVEQLFNVNDRLDSLKESQKSIINSQAVGFIGKEIKASGNTVHVEDGENRDICFKLADEAEAVFVDIYDSAGGFVRRLEKVGEFAPGEQALEWDGTNQSGMEVPDGSYNFEVRAMDAEGKMVDAENLLSGKVDGVGFEEGKACLTVEGRHVPIDAVIEVNDPEG